MPSPENAARASLPALLALSNTDPGKRLPPDRSRGAKAPHPRQTPNLPRREAAVQYFFRRTGKKIARHPHPGDRPPADRPADAVVQARAPGPTHLPDPARRDRVSPPIPECARPAASAGPPTAPCPARPFAPPHPPAWRTGRREPRRPREGDADRCRPARTEPIPPKTPKIAATAEPVTPVRNAAAGPSHRSHRRRSPQRRPRGAAPGTTPLPAFGPTAPNAGAGPARPSAHRRTG